MLKSHLTKHKSCQTDRTPDSKGNLEQKPDKNNTIWKCAICEFTSTSKPNLARHQKRHLKSKTCDFKCSKCEKAFPSKQNLKQHQMRARKQSTEV